MKHTPAPWTFVGTVNHDHVQKTQLVLQANRRNAMNIASVIPCMGMTGEEVEANARLIAAAPDLLFALQQAKLIVDEYGFQYDAGHLIIEMVDKAINKATNSKA